MYYSGITNEDIANGKGVRITLWISGCNHKCKGCHNPETWSFTHGKEFTSEIQDELFKMLDKPYISGLTLSGGDPMYSIDDISTLIKAFREKFGKTKNIWVYTGFTLEELQSDKRYEYILNNIDILVDGPFILEKRDLSLPFRGSSNQRIIDLNLLKK